MLWIVAVIGWAGCYVVACWLWPFASCWRCEGRGKFRSPSGKAWRNCGRCKGSGAKLRVGRKLWTYTRRVHTKGNR